MANEILDEVGDRYANTEYAFTIARLIDGHVKGLRGELARCRTTIEEEGFVFFPYDEVDAALKPWTEPAE